MKLRGLLAAVAARALADAEAKTHADHPSTREEDLA